ncbi:cardiolipin synthase [Lederbergia citrea]|uniref:cardiolipin synthase n=1 Tax=Lederbergia citrea TaxID=2833581 RepID=UPI001BC8E8FD|nr:cardiolipin synthase [Lederbergia citrea]MBS4178015.1 cardiolipin synthase [Lederbergia citrea]
MGWFAGIMLLILLIAIWSFADFSLGRYMYKKRWQLREYPLRKGHLQLITNGADLYKSYFQDLSEAKTSIHILFYIVKDDRFSEAFFKALMEQAKKGVKVRLLLDWLGSRKVPKSWLMDAREDGIEIAFSHRPRLPYLMFSLQQRNHRKITIIDNNIGYLGGYNIGKEYIDLDPELSPWRDYHIRLEGEGVGDVQQEFLIDWKRATGKVIQPESVVYEIGKTEMEHRLFPSEGVGVEAHLIPLFEQAEKTIVIGTPYFIPPKKLFAAIEDALDRGVKVSVLVPKKSDHSIVKEASFRFLRRILAKGGAVYQFQNGFFHAKVIVIDGKICDIGTANFDRRSIQLNHEINCFIYDLPFIKEIEAALYEDISQSSQLTFEDLQKVGLSVRTKEWIGVLIQGLL